MNIILDYIFYIIYIFIIIPNLWFSLYIFIYFIGLGIINILNYIITKYILELYYNNISSYIKIFIWRMFPYFFINSIIIIKYV
jgi:hypothetical protein